MFPYMRMAEKHACAPIQIKTSTVNPLYNGTHYNSKILYIGCLRKSGGHKIDLISLFLNKFS